MRSFAFTLAVIGATSVYSLKQESADLSISMLAAKNETETGSLNATNSTNTTDASQSPMGMGNM